MNKVDSFIEEKVLDQFKPIVKNFRNLVKKEFPELKEEMRGGTEKYFGVPAYRNKKIVVTISPTKKGITFSFSEGKQLEDKFDLLEGKGNKTLNLRVDSIDKYSDEQIRYYLKQAINIDNND